MTLRPTPPGPAALQPPPPPTSGCPVSLQRRPLTLPNPAGAPLPPSLLCWPLSGTPPNLPADGGFCFASVAPTRGLILGDLGDLCTLPASQAHTGRGSPRGRVGPGRPTARLQGRLWLRGHRGPSCASAQHLLLSVVTDPRRPKDTDVHADPAASLLTSSEDPAMQPSDVHSQRHLRDVPGPTCPCGASCEAPTSAQGSGQKTAAVARESPGPSQPLAPRPWPQTKQPSPEGWGQDGSPGVPG